jgi:pimeloyl-ACP methyl ester carboxylesterase
MGQSFGTQVAVQLGARHPESVSRIVLQGMTVDPEARTGGGSTSAGSQAWHEEIADRLPHRRLVVCPVGVY